MGADDGGREPQSRAEEPQGRVVDELPFGPVAPLMETGRLRGRHVGMAALEFADGVGGQGGFD